MAREPVAGAKAVEVSRRHGIGRPRFQAGKATIGGTLPSEVKRLEALADENAKLKRRLAEAMLDGTA